MSPEALIGMEVGQSVLQRLLGQGTMGAVYLASQPQYQVAVKVFLPASPLAQADHEEFQMRLTQVLAQGASLDHASILRTLDYGKQSGLLYQVMPYVSGENLQQLLARSGPLPLTQIQLYLEQLAAALDYAHTCGVLHRDIKPENILLTLDGNALLADFGLAGLTTEKHFACVRRATPGMLNTIAPEYVLSQPVSTRADLYSLGVVLYHMVTGRVPFQHTSLTEVARQHVKAAPPAPGVLRPDLPQAAEQVILQALAKAPSERYACAQELASAFGLALLSQPSPARNLYAVDTTAKRRSIPRDGGLFDPKWQTLATTPALQVALHAHTPPTTPEAPVASSDTGLRHSSQLLLTPFQVPVLDTTTLPEPSANANTDAPINDQPMFDPALTLATQRTDERVDRTLVTHDHISMKRSSHSQTGAQPRRLHSFVKKRTQVIGLVLAVLLIAIGSNMLWLLHNASSHQAPTINPPTRVTAPHPTPTQDHLILTDDLSQNTRDWVVGSHGSFSYAFKNGAYLIANADKVNSAPALLPNQVLHAPFTYSLTMEQLQGDLSSPNNQFGMLLDTTIQNVNGKQIEEFYTFEVANTPGGQYQFWKYDNSTDSAHPWTLLWSKNFGPEFLQGSGPQHMNTLKVMDAGKNFTFMVNGTQVGTWQGSSLTSGSIGMLVNLNGAEVAFSHLLVTSQ